VHRRVDRPKGALPNSDVADTHMRATSVELASEALGVVAKIDVLEVGNGEITPIDYKPGKKPSVADGAYDPERVQVATPSSSPTRARLRLQVRPLVLCRLKRSRRH